MLLVRNSISELGYTGKIFFLVETLIMVSVYSEWKCLTSEYKSEHLKLEKKCFSIHTESLD